MILSENRPEWHMSDLAVLDLGAVDVPVYGTLTPTQIQYQAHDSGAVAAIVENEEQMAKVLEVRGSCPELKHLIQIEGEADSGVIAMADLVDAAAGPSVGDRFWERAEAVGESDPMTIIYTSGTTGEPKGVMLTHSNMVRNVLSAGSRIGVNRDELALEFLPLCHVLERMVGYIYMWRAVTKAYCSVYDVGDLIADIKPTMFVGVPRFFEKVHQKVMEKVATAPAVKRNLFHWAMGLGKQVAYMRILGEEPTGILAARFQMADRLVLSKIREGLGGRVRFAVSGGAELPLFVNEFFHSIGVQVMEGYGLTETSPVIAVNSPRPRQTRLGTVGLPLEDVELRFAPDGELLVKGPNVMRSYWNKPDETAEAFDEDGFFRTGDIADLDDDGFLLIVDRKKDLIVTAGGKNVAPQPVENHLKQSHWVDAAVLIGDRRPYIVALISPNFEELDRWAADQDLTFSHRQEMVENPRVMGLFEDALDTANAGLARYEQIKRFRLLPITLSIESGHLTPTLKVKRRVVEQEFAELIEGLYGDEEL